MKIRAQGPDQEFEAAEAQRILESALEQVTKPNHRIAWMLRHLEGYSIAEIARILNRKRWHCEDLDLSVHGRIA